MDGATLGLPEGFTSALPITFPCTAPRLVPAWKIYANDYNPNHVISVEMVLLQLSIEEDGVTQPVVTYYDPEIDRYLVVDGFHRFTILKRLGCLEIPVVVIDKNQNNRIASTIRHNRARGKHQADLMAELVRKFLVMGFTEAEIAGVMGMEPEEVIRLKQLAGIE